MDNQGQQLNTLFTDDLPFVVSDIELEGIKQRFNQYDPYYIASGCIKERREKFDTLWTFFKPYADSHFANQYKLQFDKRVWEMYIGCILLKNTLKINSLDEGPDFIVDNNEYIECVACSNGEKNKPDSVPEIFLAQTYDEIRLQDVPDDQMILRITSAIAGKHKIYQSRKNIDKNKPYIIAVNTGSLQYPQDYFGIPLIIRALFGLQFLQINQRGESSFSWRREIQKTTTPIPVNNFTNESFKEISGVIFSNNSVLNHPDKIGDDCIFINNPFAVNRVDISRYSFFKRWAAENDKLTKLY